ncbi:hypothetical protein [Daejeonella oryzae]|uniref:hypothetical protein n=1 Tax=Daejeonella oryzae TaxID=1122943 RepID=UPI00056114EB|nr:hypothetical protein [Daejeonella oryzae]
MYYTKNIRILILLILVNIPLLSKSQTEQDALMMPQRNLCVAGIVGYSSWTNYYEGTFKRDNANIGRLSTTSAMLGLNYGLNKNVNLIASLPYVSTKASQGTLSGLEGFQDLALYVKWRPIQKQLGKQNISLFGVGGFSTPSNDYNIDFLPMSVGLGSTMLSARMIVDIQRNKFYSTISAGYLLRGNVKIDRPAYYTNRQINSNEVEMPNVGSFQFRTGYRSSKLIAEASLVNMTTLGGFDIRKNDMPFVSNKMNATSAGVEAKYYPVNNTLGLNASVWHTLEGRNVGQSTGYSAGILYTINFKSKTIAK